MGPTKEILQLREVVALERDEARKLAARVVTLERELDAKTEEIASLRALYRSAIGERDAARDEAKRAAAELTLALARVDEPWGTEEGIARREAAHKEGL